MGGVFMRKIIILATLFMFVVYCGGLVEDMQTMHNGIIRLHVVGASDSEADQRVKLAVKDAVNVHLQDKLQPIDSIEEAKVILEREMDSIQAVAEQVLRFNGFSDTVTVSLEKEVFPIREYETFTLPSGVYESLRIRIGNAEGRNWWCVVFPSLCLPAESNSEDVPASHGFSDRLYDTLTGEDGYEIRFFLLDWLGQLQNIWFAS